MSLFVFRPAVLGIYVAAKSENASQHHQKKSETNRKPHRTPEKGQLEYCGENGGDIGEEAGGRANDDFFQDRTILH